MTAVDDREFDESGTLHGVRGLSNGAASEGDCCTLESGHHCADRLGLLKKIRKVYVRVIPCDANAFLLNELRYVFALLTGADESDRNC